MKKQLIIVVLYIICIYSYSAELETDKNLVKRNIAIIPFSNSNNVEEYDYLSDTLRDTLKAKLLEKNQFIITNFSTIDNIIKQKKIPNEHEINEKHALEIGLESKSDVAVIGKFVIIEDKIMINIEVIDIFTKKSAASTIKNGEVGIDIFRLIDEATEDISNKMVNELKMVEMSYFQKMMDIINEKRLKPINKVGISLIVTGSTFILTGFPILIVNVSYYSDIVSAKINIYNDEPTDANYEDYSQSYNIYIGFFCSSIILLSAGGILLAIGIPFLLVRKKRKNISFKFETGQNIRLSFCLKF